jgi:hypothetical protein
MLSQRHTEDVCLLYQGSKQCRYLESDPYDYTKFYCRKLTGDRKILDELVEEHVQKCLDQGDNPADSNMAQGDHCSGFVYFKSMVQGYDVE